MDARSYTAEERRAANQVWAAAGAYGFEPLFLARNTDGTIDFYMNCVVGLVHKYYGDDLLRDLFATWDGDLRESQLDDLTWLYLESAVYLLELPRRPVLSELRRAHADYFFGIQYKLSRQEWMAKNQLVYTMQADRWRTVQGRHPPVMTPYESRLAEALSPSQPPQPGQLKGELLGLFARFALFDGRIRHKVGLHLHLEGLLASLATKTLPTQMIKTDRLTVEHSGSVEAGGSGPTADKRLAHITLRQNAAEDRAYIESCFGRSLYPPERLRKAEQALCTGAHLGWPPLVCLRRAQPGTGPHTGGKAPGRTGSAAGRPQPCLLRQKPGTSPQCGAPAHRADPQLHSGPPAAQCPDRPQRRSGPGAGLARSPSERQPGVPLCRGGESALLHRGPAAGRFGFPAPLSGGHCGAGHDPGPESCRLRHPGAGQQLLQPAGLYGSAGAQGLCGQKPAGDRPVFCIGLEPRRPCLRAAGDLVSFDPGPAPRHLLILLTDASPNDSRRVPPSPEQPLGCDYGGSYGVDDAAAEVRTLRRKGLRVSAVFMGEDSSSHDAERIYGKNLARIRGMDQLARAAGRLIQNEIRELGD